MSDEAADRTRCLSRPEAGAIVHMEGNGHGLLALKDEPSRKN